MATSKAAIDLWQLSEGEFASYDRPLLEIMGLETSLINQLLLRTTITSHSAPTLAYITRDTNRLAIVDQLTAIAAMPGGVLTTRKLAQQTTYGLALIKRLDQILSASLKISAEEIFHLCSVANLSA